VNVSFRAPVSGFEKKLERSFPELYRKLKESTEGAVTYGEVEHWMWRLFLDDFGQATEAVGLPSIPFLNSSGCVPSSLPPPTPLIYGISPHVLQSQPYWPPSVCLSGYWPLDERYLSPPTADDVRIVSSLQSPILYAGFGSMEDVYEIEWKKMVKLLANAAAAHKMEVVLQSRRVPPSSLTTYPSIHLLSNPVPHQWLFPRCSIILCHGGCGTVSSALLSGKPIIVSPFGFDQFFWAEQVEWLGVGRQCSHADTITEEELTKAVGFVTCPHVQQAVENMAGKLSQEKGIESAMDILVKHLNLSS
jgi:sterol 3beta-glucosyltransferase